MSREKDTKEQSKYRSPIYLSQLYLKRHTYNYIYIYIYYIMYHSIVQNVERVIAVRAEMCQRRTFPWSVIQQWCCSHFHGADISSCRSTSKMEVCYTFGRSPQSYRRKRKAHSLQIARGLTRFRHGNQTEQARRAAVLGK